MGDAQKAGVREVMTASDLRFVGRDVRASDASDDDSLVGRRVQLGFAGDRLARRIGYSLTDPALNKIDGPTRSRHAEGSLIRGDS